MKLITLCVLISLPQFRAGKFDKCKRFCHGTIPHTTCYPKGGGNECKNNEKVYLSIDEKRTILEYHNSKRNAVAKGNLGNTKVTASNMMKLVWNGEMGMLAKRWADQCNEGEHDKCRTTYSNNATGQNSYIGKYKNTGAKPDQKAKERNTRLKMIMDTWFNEIDLVEKTDVEAFNTDRTAVIGNVTQLIWADTIYIGCGYTEFTLANNFLEFRFVCDYTPSGLIEGKAMFKEGEPSSKCPKGSKTGEYYTGLCFNGKKNEFVDDNKAHIGKPAFYTIALIAFITSLRVLM